MPVKPLSPATASAAFGSLPVPALPSRPSVAVLPIFAALSMTLRVASSKPMFTTPFSSVVIAIPVLASLLSVSFVVLSVLGAKSVGAIVPVPDLKCKPSATPTFLVSVSEFAL